MQRRDFSFKLVPGLALTLTGISLTGCSSGLGAVLQPPKLDIDAIQLLSASPRQQNLRFASRLTNPNPLPMPLQSANMGLSIAGVDMGRASLPQPLSLPAQGQGQTYFDLQTDLLTAVQQMGGLRAVGLNTPLPYALQGQLGLSSYDFKLPVDKQGSFTLSQLGASLTRLMGLPF